MTFVEVMVTIVILSTGIVMIMKSFIVSVDRMSYLNSRLYAHIMLDNRLAIIQRRLRVFNSLPLDAGKHEKVSIGAKVVEFKPTINISEVEEFKDIFLLDLTMNWEEGSKDFKLSRSALVSDFRPLF